MTHIFTLFFLLFSFVFVIFVFSPPTATAKRIPLSNLKLSCTNQLKFESFQSCQISWYCTVARSAFGLNLFCSTAILCQRELKYLSSFSSTLCTTFKSLPSDKSKQRTPLSHAIKGNLKMLCRLIKEGCQSVELNSFHSA